MKVSVQVAIKGSKEAVWRVITDIGNAAENISGIERVEILEQPQEGLIGLKWRETRTLFGKTATEVMWITGAEAVSYYETRAESHGAVYVTRLSLSEKSEGCLLILDFTGKTQTLGAKIMSFIFGPMFDNATRKALQQDLQDIKTVVERK